MKNRVYYGEFTLQHWIDLMINKDIVMPKYQRSFVWDEERTKKMILNLKKKYFVPPVIIGRYNTDVGEQNLILDGQQRLTSLLLSQLNVFPDKSKFASSLKHIMDDNDDSTDGVNKGICDWRYDILLVDGKKKPEEIKAGLDMTKYIEVDYKVGGTFYTENYLGFCYIVPSTIDEQPQKSFFSSLFRNINSQGIGLIPQESRASLYFLDETKEGFFMPKYTDDIKIKSNKGVIHMDYVRYLALLSNYTKEGGAANVAVNRDKNFEQYYEEYIEAVIGDVDSPIFGKFSTLFPKDKLETRMNLLEQHIKNLEFDKKTYPSIIDLDVDFFGLIYYVLYEGKEIDLTNKVQMLGKLQRKTKKFKDDKKHAKTPAGINHIRSRIKDSIGIYKDYLKHDEA